MGCKLSTTVLIAVKQLVPKTPDQEEVKVRDNRAKEKQKDNHDSHHGVRELPNLKPGDAVCG